MGASQSVDCFGFTEYAVVLHADEAQLAAVRSFRHSIGLRRAMYEAHVTVKGTFRGVTDLSTVRTMVERTAKPGFPFEIEFAGAPCEVAGSGFWVPVRLSTPLAALHHRVEEALERLCDDAYEMPVFSPHLTLCYGCTSEQLVKAKQLVAGVCLGSGFTARSLELMARTGDPLCDGYCTLIDSFPLGNDSAGTRDELRSFYRALPSQP